MQHSADLTVEAMMLDSKASDLDKEERPEVYSSYKFCILRMLIVVVNVINSVLYIR